MDTIRLSSLSSRGTRLLPEQLPQQDVAGKRKIVSPLHVFFFLLSLSPVRVVCVYTCNCCDHIANTHLPCIESEAKLQLLE